GKMRCISAVQRASSAAASFSCEEPYTVRPHSGRQLCRKLLALWSAGLTTASPSSLLRWKIHAEGTPDFARQAACAPTRRHGRHHRARQQHSTRSARKRLRGGARTRL